MGSPFVAPLTVISQHICGWGIFDSDFKELGKKERKYNGKNL